MTYTVPYTYLRAMGTFGPTAGAGAEEWVVGMKIPSTGTTPSPANLAAFLTACAPAVSTFHADTRLKAGSWCFLTALTAAHLDQQGHYVGGGTQKTTTYTYPTAVAGVGTAIAGLDTCTVLSLRTAIARGRGSHGRDRKSVV